MPWSVNCFITLAMLIAWLLSLAVKPCHPPVGITAVASTSVERSDQQRLRLPGWKIAPDALTSSITASNCDPSKVLPDCAWA